jgi:arginyl-tRNA synthetase
VPVLKADTPALVENRLFLSQLTARTLAEGLELLGIRTPDRLKPSRPARGLARSSSRV